MWGLLGSDNMSDGKKKKKSKHCENCLLKLSKVNSNGVTKMKFLYIYHTEFRKYPHGHNFYLIY